MKKALLLAARPFGTHRRTGAGQEAVGYRRERPRQPVLRGDQPRLPEVEQGERASEYECLYTGPASTSDEAGEAQIVQDMLGKADTAAIAISPSNAKLIAQTLKTAKPTVPVMTLDADLAAEDFGAAQDLSWD